MSNDQASLVVASALIFGTFALLISALIKFFPATEDAQEPAPAAEAGSKEKDPEPEQPKAPTRWHMEPPAKMVIELELDKVPPSMALGSLLQMQDIVKAFYQEQAQKAAQLKNRIVKPSMVDRTEAILRRPS